MRLARIEPSEPGFALLSARNAMSRNASARRSGFGELLLLFHHHNHGTNGGQPHLVAFHLRDQALVDEVMVALVATLPAVLLSQLDAVAFDLVDGANVNAVRADNFHVLFDVGHWMSSVESRNAPGPVMFEAIYPQSEEAIVF